LGKGFGGWKRGVNDLFDSSSHQKIGGTQYASGQTYDLGGRIREAEREIARLEAVGELDGVELHIVHWQTDEAIAAANELMRKLKAAREPQVIDPHRLQSVPVVAAVEADPAAAELSGGWPRSEDHRFL
jgi:hypothetical protein